MSKKGEEQKRKKEKKIELSNTTYWRQSVSESALTVVQYVLAKGVLTKVIFLRCCYCYCYCWLSLLVSLSHLPLSLSLSDSSFQIFFSSFHSFIHSFILSLALSSDHSHQVSPVFLSPPLHLPRSLIRQPSFHLPSHKEQ